MDRTQPRVDQASAVLLLALCAQQQAPPVAAFRPAMATQLEAKVEKDFQCLKIPLEQ
jgi:hypothetical protein